MNFYVDSPERKTQIVAFYSKIAKIMSDDVVEVEGKIVSVLPGTMFRVEIAGGHQVLAHISGKLRKNFIKLTVGDKVKMEMTPHDIEKARIVYRLKNAEPVHPPSFPRRSFGPRH